MFADCGNCFNILSYACYKFFDSLTVETCINMDGCTCTLFVLFFPNDRSLFVPLFVAYAAYIVP